MVLLYKNKFCHYGNAFFGGCQGGDFLFVKEKTLTTLLPALREVTHARIPQPMGARTRAAGDARGLQAPLQKKNALFQAPSAAAVWQQVGRTSVKHLTNSGKKIYFSKQRIFIDKPPPNKVKYKKQKNRRRARQTTFPKSHLDENKSQGE